LDFVSLHAQSKPDAVAQIEEDRRVTWRELLERRNKVAGALAKRGVAAGHILADGTIEPHAATEERLLAMTGEHADLFGDRTTGLDAAYRRRARKVAARAKG